MNLAEPAPFLVDEWPANRHSLRIAVVTETWPPEVNGVATTIARVVEGLHARGHDLQLVRPRQHRGDAPGDAPRLGELLMRGLPIPQYPNLRMGLPAAAALARRWSLARPDVVHVATEGPLGWSAVRAARRLRLPVTSDFRTNFHAYSRHYGIGWLRKPIVAYLRRFHNATRFTMVPTEALRAELAASGFERLLVVARGVDTRRFGPQHRSEALRASWGLRAGDRAALYVGRLAPEKNLDLLLRAFDALRAGGARWRLVLVGDGPLRRELQQHCPEALCAGLRRGEDLAAHYASGDLFVFPSLTETYGNVVPEAMASGLPVLAFDHAAASELVVDGRNGRKVPAGDAGAFVRAARELGAEAELPARLGPQARLSALDLDWERIVVQVETAFLTAMLDHQVPRLGARLADGLEAAGASRA
ncbi:MAG: glycosyltransferase family 1 protein [Rubrivivax sp.]|nr:glycosyltransferase family 1 protein [Rubrivivax sp.]